LDLVNHAVFEEEFQTYSYTNTRPSTKTKERYISNTIVKAKVK